MGRTGQTARNTPEYYVFLLHLTRPPPSMTDRRIVLDQFAAVVFESRGKRRLSSICNRRFTPFRLTTRQENGHGCPLQPDTTLGTNRGLGGEWKRPLHRQGRSHPVPLSFTS